MKLVELQLFLEVIKVIFHWDFEVRKFGYQVIVGNFESKSQVFLKMNHII